MASFLSWFENIFSTTEADVLGVIADIKSGEQVAANAIDSALKWVAANVPSIDAAIQEVVTLVETAGIVNPAVLAAIADANKAVAGLNAFAAAIQAGTPDAQAVIAGYVAAKNAQVAAATAAANAANSSPPVKTS